MATKLFQKIKQKTTSRRAAEATSATQKATQTYELLEQILAYLDPHSLRQARLVNNYWHSIVCDSSTLAGRFLEADRPRNVSTVPIGVPGVGINSLVTRFAHADVAAAAFPFDPDPTWEPAFRSRIVVDSERWLIDGTMGGYLHDESSGAREVRFLGQTLANCDTYMLLYSVSSRFSFDRLRAWVEQMNSGTEPLSLLVATKNRATRRRGGQRCVPAAVVSTKNDLHAELWAVQPSEGAAFARELGCPFVETSAKTGAGVQEAFAEACRTYKRARLETLAQRSKRSSLGRGVPAAAAEAKERRERWWRWYRARQQQT